jgi:hypothetical protein
MDARCGDGWENEGKSAGAPVCEDENLNEDLPCSSLKDSCTNEAVQARCAATCNTPSKGTKECKQIAKMKDQYKCVRKFSCSANPRGSSPPGIRWNKPVPRKGQSGCGGQANIQVGGCSTDPKNVDCSCPSAYVVSARSIATSDCEMSDYKLESKTILDRLLARQEHTEQFLQTCASVFESSRPYKTTAPRPGELVLKNEGSTVWETKSLHSLSLPMQADGCEANFVMKLSVCRTSPFKHMTVDVPFSGKHYLNVGCGCQEIIAEVTYNGQVSRMPNKMKSTQKLCAKHFAKWNMDFQKNYYFGGIDYLSQAIRIAREIRKQCADPGWEPSPDQTHKIHTKMVETALKANQMSIRAQSKNVQVSRERVLQLQKDSAQCEASLPKRTDSYKQLVGRVAIEPDAEQAKELKAEAIHMKKNLNTQDHVAARLKMAKEKEDKADEDKEKKKAEEDAKKAFDVNAKAEAPK